MNCNRNVLVQFSGQGCREYEEVMREQQTDWRTWLYSIWKNQGKLEAGYTRVQCSRFDIALDELWDWKRKNISISLNY